MKAISLWQPWASLVAIGAKRFETRSFPTKYRGPLAIHAAKRWTQGQRDLCQREPFYDALKEFRVHRIPIDGKQPSSRCELLLGCIVAVCELAGCLTIGAEGTLAIPEVTADEFAFGDWSPGRWAWRLENVVRIEPLSWNGRQGFFDVPDIALEKLLPAVAQ